MKKLLTLTALTLGLAGCGITDTLTTRYASESNENLAQIKEKSVVVVNSKMSSVVNKDYFTNIVLEELKQKGFRTVAVSPSNKLGQPEVAAVLTIQKRVDAVNSPVNVTIAGNAGASRGGSQGKASRMSVESVTGYYASLDWFDIESKEKLMSSTVAVTDTECSEKAVTTFLTQHLVERLGQPQKSTKAYSVALPDGLKCN